MSQRAETIWQLNNKLDIIPPGILDCVYRVNVLRVNSIARLKGSRNKILQTGRRVTSTLSPSERIKAKNPLILKKSWPM